MFARHGVILTEAECMQTTGTPIGDVARYWYERRPWRGAAPEPVAGENLAGVLLRVRAGGRAMPGALRTIRLMRRLSLRLAPASPSARILVDAVVERLDTRPRIDAVCSADEVARGKPHPDVHLAAAARLGDPPAGCPAL